MNKNPILALILSLAPGLGHWYLNKKGRAFLYGAGFLVIALVGILSSVITERFEVFFVSLLLGMAVWGVNLLDMILTLIRRQPYVPGEEAPEERVEYHSDERLLTILLSLIPGLGHFQLGLMNRGVTLLAGFVGMGTMIVFVTFLTQEELFALFLAFLPVIWIYGLYDCVRMLELKRKGEPLPDRSLLEDWEESWGEGKKSKIFALLLSLFPGAGHLYLGLQRRGLQLMFFFLFTIYILDALRLSLFLFLVPIIWFFSFFDALQQVSVYRQQGKADDRPLVYYLLNHQKWVGIGLFLLGGYYLFENVGAPVVADVLKAYYDIDFYYWYHQYFQKNLVSVLLIGGGIKLMIGSRKRRSSKDA